MPDLIRYYDNQNQPIVDHNSDVLSLVYFNLLHLTKGQPYRQQLRPFETVFVVLNGNCDITVSGSRFSDIGQRKDIWSGNADSVYAPPGAEVQVAANSEKAEIAVAGGRCQESREAFRIPPEEVDMVEVGSIETNSRRCIYHILGKNADGRAGNLLVSELYADKGCWSGYPPHKHDEERWEQESEFEEIYHYRFRPDTGFGAQIAFQPDGSSQAFMTRNGDTFLLDRGYHPTVTSPGHDGYIFTIIVGRQRRSLIQHFSDEHNYLIGQIPGLQDMVDKFK
ncbi:MAG: inositol utilization protein [Deltaproteobacteria bacterium SG8_13]|nr:MAG: inositol utilization protein [Deltaproteobacteria bacterium SG8_13]